MLWGKKRKMPCPRRVVTISPPTLACSRLISPSIPRPLPRGVVHILFWHPHTVLLLQLPLMYSVKHNPLQYSLEIKRELRLWNHLSGQTSTGKRRKAHSLEFPKPCWVSSVELPCSKLFSLPWCWCFGSTLGQQDKWVLFAFCHYSSNINELNNITECFFWSWLLFLGAFFFHEEVGSHFRASLAWQVSLKGHHEVVWWSPSPCVLAAPGWHQWRGTSGEMQVLLGHSCCCCCLRGLTPARHLSPPLCKGSGTLGGGSTLDICKGGIHIVCDWLRNGISNIEGGNTSWDTEVFSLLAVLYYLYHCTFLQKTASTQRSMLVIHQKEQGHGTDVHIWVITPRQHKVGSCFPCVRCCLLG